MNKLRILSKMLLTLGMCWALGSCSGDEPFAQDQAQQPSHSASQHLTMNLVGNISRYHQGNKLKAAAESSTTWTENDTIYITFKKGTSTVAGVATYKAGKWDVEVDGYLDSGTNLECTAHYFVNATTTENSVWTSIPTPRSTKIIAALTIIRMATLRCMPTSLLRLGAYV